MSTKKSFRSLQLKIFVYLGSMYEPKQPKPKLTFEDSFIVKLTPIKIPQGSKQVGNYIIGKTIGDGAFGRVHLGLNIPTGEKVAIKIIQKSKLSSKEFQHIHRQIKILQKIVHPNLIELYEIIQTQKSLLLVTEYISNGELFNYIIQHKKLQQQQACRIFHQIINGVAYLHEVGVTHRDIKPENILLTTDGKVKIIDFGLSNMFQPQKKLKTACGSPSYAAPEMVQGKIFYSPQKIDIWSCGVTLYVMMIGALPFSDPDTAALFKKIINGKFKIPSHVSQDGKDLLCKILTKNPNDRIPLQEIIEHPWFTQIPFDRVRGINIAEYLVPFDEEVIQKMQELNFLDQKIDIRYDLQENKKTKYTALYYMLVRKIMKQYKITKYYGSKDFDKGCLHKKFQEDVTISAGVSAPPVQFLQKPKPFKNFKVNPQVNVKNVLNQLQKQEIPKVQEKNKLIFYSWNPDNHKKRQQLTLEEKPKNRNNKMVHRSLPRRMKNQDIFKLFYMK